MSSASSSSRARFREDESIAMSSVPSVSGSQTTRSTSSDEAATPSRKFKHHPLFLHVAVRDNDYDWVQNVLQEGDKPDVIEYQLHRHPLHLSIRQGSLRITELLLEYGCSPNVCDRMKKRAPIHYAIIYNRVEELRLLLENGADINQQSRNGKTALHIAAENGNLMLALFLLVKKPNVHIKDKKGKTAHWYAVKNGWPDVAALIRATWLMRQFAAMQSHTVPDESSI